MYVETFGKTHFKWITWYYLFTLFEKQYFTEQQAENNFSKLPSIAYYEKKNIVKKTFIHFIALSGI